MRPFFLFVQKKLLKHKKNWGGFGADRTLFLGHVSHSTAKRVDVLCYREAGGAATHPDPKSVGLKVPPIPQGGCRATCKAFFARRRLLPFVVCALARSPAGALIIGV